MLQQDAAAAPELGPWQPPNGQPYFAPKAKSVIWIFLSGGYSHLETFDPKPMLNRFAGKTFKETPFEDPESSPILRERSRSVVEKERELFSTIYPMQVGFRKRGQSGIEVTDWWPHLSNCVDDISFVRNMYTTDNDHAAENQIHTGRHKLDETQPSIGAWASYGLGSLNDNLPRFVVLGGPTRSDTKESIEGYYLGPKYRGIPLNVSSGTPLLYGQRGTDITAQEQQNEYEFIGRLNRMALADRPDDEALKARIRAYELAYRMQAAVPDALDLSSEQQHIFDMYGMSHKSTRLAAKRCLAARRLVERGVRFVQVFPTSYGSWDSHTKLKERHTDLCRQVDQPVAGLLQDLKQRGLMDDVVVVFCTEFGRTPAAQGDPKLGGRDHHPHGFTIWLAGAGIKKGHVHGATDELGYHAIDPGHYVTDLHATVLHLLGLSPQALDVPGRQRLDVDRGEAIHDILA